MDNNIININKIKNSYLIIGRIKIYYEDNFHEN